MTKMKAVSRWIHLPADHLTLDPNPDPNPNQQIARNKMPDGGATGGNRESNGRSAHRDVWWD